MTTEGGLEAYVLAIERHFRTLRGADRALSPRDFALARSFYEAGVPLAHVLVGIDRALEKDPLAASLAFCRRHIEELSEGLRPGPGRDAPREAVPLAVVEEALAALEERLLELPPGPRAAFGVVLPRVRELKDLVAVATSPNWDYLRSKLAEVDEAVGHAAPAALEPEVGKAVEAELTRARERHRGRVDEASLQGALERLARARAREHLRLPRVNVV